MFHLTDGSSKQDIKHEKYGLNLKEKQKQTFWKDGSVLKY